MQRLHNDHSQDAQLLFTLCSLIQMCGSSVREQGGCYLGHKSSAQRESQSVNPIMRLIMHEASRSHTKAAQASRGDASAFAKATSTAHAGVGHG